MRSVFVRRRKEQLQTPAWMGGLNYEDVGLDGGPALRSQSQGRKSMTRMSSSRTASEIASGMQTRVATGCSLPWNALFQNSPTQEQHQVISKRRSSESISKRPSSELIRESSAHHDSAHHLQREGSAARRPLTAGHSFRTSQLSVDDTRAPTLQRSLSARAGERQRESKSPWNLKKVPSTGDALRPQTARSNQQVHALPGVKAPDKPQKLYYTLCARILGVRGHDRMQDPNSEADTSFNAVVSLSIEGSTYMSKPMKITRLQTMSVPDDLFIFQLQGGIYGSLLNVKLLRKYGEVAKDQSPEIGTAFVDLASVQKSGGSEVINCKLSSETSSKVSPEVHLELRLITKSVDFNFSYVGQQPTFKKSGYTITPDGITSFPLPYRKKGLPGGCTLKSLQIKEVRADEPQGVVVYRAVKEDDGTWYTIKRFSIMHMDPRNMLISEMNGLLDGPPQLSIPPLDAFLDRLDVVLVLDEMQGRYLRTIVQKKGKMPEQNISIVLRQLLQVLRYLHENKMRVHNDIDANNILVLKQGEIRLGGFCYSAKNVGKARKFAGPYVHMSPERLLGLDCGFPADVWSLGILTLELTLGRLPYDMSEFTGPNALFEFKKRVVTEPSPHLLRGEEQSDDLRHFVDSCLHKNLKLRLSISALITHPFVTKYESLQNNFLGRWVLKEKKEERAKSSEAQPIDSGKGKDRVGKEGKGSGEGKPELGRRGSILAGDQAVRRGSLVAGDQIGRRGSFVGGDQAGRRGSFVAVDAEKGK